MWCTEEYYTFSAFILVTALGSALVNLFDVRRNLLEVQRLSRFSTSVTAIRGGAAYTMDSSELAPGDVVLITHGLKLPCDVVLVRGQATVTEAMLTGESTVCSKQPARLADIATADARSTLFGGTQVVELRVPKGKQVRGVVVRTGFETVKGRLVLSILHPRDAHFKFMEESVKFVILLFLGAMVGFGLNVKALLDLGSDVGHIVQRGCDMVTIVVPPALPLALTVGVIYAVVALRKQKVFCISPGRVNLAGKVNAVVFDKTGTLTGESLELALVHPAANAAFGAATSAVDAVPAAMQHVLACCHSLTYVGTEVAGDPLEIKTFGFVRATLDEPHTAPDLPSGVISRVRTPAAATDSGHVPFEAFVLHQFEFVPALQRMGVLARVNGGPVYSYVKGSPEMISTLCNPATLPHDFTEVLNNYTRHGYRVLAAAAKVYAGPLPGSSAAGALMPEQARVAAESNLEFLGFIVLQNKLKPETAGTIAKLRTETDNSLVLAMATGDNAMAAVCIARECGLVEPGYRVFIGDVAPNAGADVTAAAVVWTDADGSNTTGLDPLTLQPRDGSAAVPYRLALTGRAFLHLLTLDKAGLLEQGFLPRLVLNCAVFARMSPENKAALVTVLQSAGMYVMMVGDGANDSMALRAAHVGISLSQVEASVAAPFTSMIPNISCVPLVMREGRGALTTSFCLFQFMCCYSTIQFANALLVVFVGSFLSNNEYLYQDLWLVFVLALTSTCMLFDTRMMCVPGNRVRTLVRAPFTSRAAVLTHASESHRLVNLKLVHAHSTPAMHVIRALSHAQRLQWATHRLPGTLLRSGRRDGCSRRTTSR